MVCDRLQGFPYFAYLVKNISGIVSRAAVNKVEGRSGRLESNMKRKNCEEEEMHPLTLVSLVLLRQAHPDHERRDFK